MTVQGILRLAQAHHEIARRQLERARELVKVRHYDIEWVQAIEQALVKNQESDRHIGNIAHLIEPYTDESFLPCQEEPAA